MIEYMATLFLLGGLCKAFEQTKREGGNFIECLVDGLFWPFEAGAEWFSDLLSKGQQDD